MFSVFELQKCCHANTINGTKMVFKFKWGLFMHTDMVEESVRGNHPYVWLVALLFWSTFLSIHSWISYFELSTPDLYIQLLDPSPLRCLQASHIMFKAKSLILSVVVNNTSSFVCLNQTWKYTFPDPVC